MTVAGRQPKEVADELGISVTSLRDWIRLSGVSPKEAGRSNKDAKRIRELEVQVRELRKAAIEKDEVINVLKKSSVVLLCKTALRAPSFLRVHIGILSKP